MKPARMFPAVLALVLAACGAADDEAAAPNAAPATIAAYEVEDPVGASLWQVDREASSVGFRATQNKKAFDGSFSRWDASILMNPEAPEEEGRIEAAIDLGSADAGNSERNNALPSADWFDTARYPVAVFRSDDIRRIEGGENTYEAIGTLTIKGVTRDVTMPFTLDIEDGGRAVADGSVMLDRSQFNVGAGEFATGEWVGLEVEVLLHIEAGPAA